MTPRAGFQEALTSLLRKPAPGGEDALWKLWMGFGSLTNNNLRIVSDEIFAAAKRYKMLCNDPLYKGPSRGELIDQLDKVREAAKDLGKALERLHPVSLAWLTGGAVARLPNGGFGGFGFDGLEFFMMFRYLPAGVGLSPGEADSPLRGPRALRANPEFVRLFDEAFAPELSAFERDMNARASGLQAEEAAVVEEIEHARDDYALRAARQKLLKIFIGYFSRREDLIAPVAKRANSLSRVAELARDEIAAKWTTKPGGHGDGLELVHVSPDRELAMACWELITNFYGEEGYDKIKTTPTGEFGCFVKAVARYASGRKLTEFAFDRAIRYAHGKGKRHVEYMAGRDPFVAFNQAKERLGNAPRLS